MFFIFIVFSGSTVTVCLIQDAEFHTYVKPVLNPVLSDFCKRLTGIGQVRQNSVPMTPELHIYMYT